MTEIVPATNDIVARLYPTPLPRSARVLAAIDGDRVLGIGGVYVEAGRQVVFCGIAEEARAELPKHARALLRCAREVLKMTERRALPVFAWADTQYAGAERLLEHLGFERFDGEIYRYG